jgi:hypothetical protein
LKKEDFPTHGRICARISFLIAAGVFLFGFCGLLTGLLGRKESAVWVKLSSRIPLEIGGWIGVDVPLGADNLEIRAVEKLNYNDYIYRKYQKGAAIIYIYAMHWHQGMISVREMGGHTPDGCWVANGARHAADPRSESFSLDGQYTQPAEIREFKFAGHADHINVAWWHLWGGKSVPVTYAEKNPSVLLSEVYTWLFEHRGLQKDQIFVRIHSSSPIEEAVFAPPSEAFLKEIREVFIVKKNLRPDL